MTVPVLQMSCSKCQVAATCPRRGSSPLASGARNVAFCRIVGGYGREPVDPSILSGDSAVASRRDGSCLTIAEVPVMDEPSGHVQFVVTKIFHQPVLHPREKTETRMDILSVHSYKE